MAGIPIHALRMMSFLAYLMLKAKKRLSTGLWRVWNNRNAVAFHRLIEFQQCNYIYHDDHGIYSYKP